MIERSLSTIMAMDEQTMTVQPPTLLLEKRSGEVIGQLHYVNWNISFVGNGIDEISFDVYKPKDITDEMDDEEKEILKEQHKIWNNLVDLKIVEIKDFARYEISVSYTDSTETVKSVHGQSLEVELAQLILRSLYVNEQDYITSEITDYNGSDYDENGNFVPTVFCDKENTAHSLLHRVLKDKAPHWSIGEVTPYVVPNEGSEPESVESFIRTYTADGVSIYDFLTGDVATETNVVFVFDTLNREINCYSLYDGIDPETKENKCTTVGKDTMIFVSKDKLAKEISIDSDKDSVKNYFKVEGGDDIINSRIRVVNVTGDYICSFNTSQLNDMSENLREKIKDRNAEVDEQTDNYEKLYSNLCKQYNYQNYYSSSMMPGVSIVKETGEILDSSIIKNKSSAKEQYDNLISKLEEKDFKVAVTSLASYSSKSFLGITNNVEAYAEVFVDSRYNVKVESGSTSYDDTNKTWKGKFIITRASDEDEYYPNTDNAKKEVSITITESDVEFARQKIEKKLKQGDIVNVKFDLDVEYEKKSDGSEIGYVGKDGLVIEDRIRDYFTEKEVTVTITPDNGDPYERDEIQDGQSLARLKSIEDAYESCISVLSSMGTKDEGTDEYIMYSNYVTIRDIVKEVREVRETQIKAAEEEISSLNKDMQDIRSKFNLETYFGEELYKELCSYLREDTYTNSNYISDGLTDTECLEKAKELVAVAKKELAKSCVLQRTVSTSLSNLFVIPEFEKLYDKFNLFNYIRVQTSDEILKLRLVQIDYNGDSAADINVVFSEQIETVDGSISDVQSILNQASSMATQFSSTVRQASQGAEANNTFTELYNNGLNAANIMLKDSDSNEITFGSYGLLCRNMGDEGSYGDKQLRIIGNGMYLTDDAWKTVKMAVGQVTVDKEEKYGIIADVIVGKLLVGNTLSIENGDGENESTVKIDKNGITIKNGLIQSSNYSETDGTGSMLKLEDGTFSFGNKSFVWDGKNLNISGSATFTGNVYANYLEATTGGKIGSLDIIKEEKEEKEGNKDVIRTYNYLSLVDTTNPKKVKKIMCLGQTPYNLNDEKDIIVINPEPGDSEASFVVTDKGTFMAENGIVGPWYINKTAIYKGNPDESGVNEEYYGAKKTMYFGNKGLSISNKFKIDSEGVLETTGGSIVISGKEKNTCLIEDGTIVFFPDVMTRDEIETNEGDDFTVYSSEGFFIGASDAEGYKSFIGGGLEVRESIDSGGSVFVSTDTSDSRTVNVSNSNGAVRLGTSTNRGLYDTTNSRWLIYTTSGTGGNIWIPDSLYLKGSDVSLYGGTASESKRIIRRDSSTIKVGNTTEPLLFFSKNYDSGVSLKDTASDERLKKDFTSLDSYEEMYMDLDPISFKYSYEKEGKTHFGIKAQNVSKALKKYNYKEDEFSIISKRQVNSELKKSYKENTGKDLQFDEMYELDYNEFIMLNTHMIQKNVHKIEDLEETILIQQDTIASLRAELDSIKVQLQELLSCTA